MSKYTIEDFKNDFKKAVSHLTGEVGTQKFATAKLQDGTTITYEGDTPMANMPVFVVDEKGNQTPLITGTHTLEDGSVLNVKDGVITDVQDKPASSAPATPAAPVANDGAPQPNQAMTEEEKKAQAKSIIETISKEHKFITEEVFNAKVKELTDASAKVTSENEALKKDNEAITAKFTAQTEAFTKLSELVGKLGDAPATTPATAVVVDEPNKEDKFKAFSKSVFKN